MADALLQAELLAACSALGYSDGIKYHKEADCLETVKDLIRYLRRDDDSHEIRRALSETKVLQTDLLPIIKFHSNDNELFDVTLRLLVNLTNPIILLFKEELPEDKVGRQQYHQMICQQQGFKEVFADENIWNVLVGRLGKILEQDWEERDEDDKLIVERILILVRNILSVSADTEAEKRTDDDASVHDQVLWALHLSHFEDLILYIASSDSEQELSMHVVEIISLMLKEQDPAQLAKAGLVRSQSEKEKDEEELVAIRKKEMLVKQQQMKKHYNARHSRFGGTFYVQNLKSISEREVISHKHIKDVNEISFDNLKKRKKINKNMFPLKEIVIKRRSTLAIRIFLQEFCVEFLNSAYNRLMYIVKDNINRAGAQEHDGSYYLWAMRFFLEFNRNHNFKVELITESLNIQTFHYIQTQIDTYYESMVVDKKKIPLWSRRMHKALNAYHSLIMTLLYMDKFPDASVQESSKILKSKIFYVVEYREMLLVMLQNYSEIKMSRAYLKDLVEAVNVFFKLLESSCKNQRHLIVQKKDKLRKKKKSKKSRASTKKLPQTEEELTEAWDDISERLLDIIRENDVDLPATIPFDPISDVPEDEQREKAMKDINKYLRTKELEMSVSLLRSARDMWPEGGIFGSIGIDSADELLCLRAIYMANINTLEEIAPQQEEFESFSDTEDEDQVNEVREHELSEQEFNYADFVRRFGNTKVMQSYGIIFKDFLINEDYTNHCILKLFHRLAWDSKMPGLFFQASMFRVFQQILDAPGDLTNSMKDAIQFIKYILRQFFKVVETNDKVYVEMLFWKSNKEAVELEIGYNMKEPSKALKHVWSEEQENELQVLYEEFRDKVIGTGKDLVDLICDNLISADHNRRAVMKKLRDMGLERKGVSIKIPKQWTEEEENELRTLFEDLSSSMDPLTSITDRLTVKRPKNRVKAKILELGLVQDRKDLFKKRGGKRKEHNAGGRSKSGGNPWGRGDDYDLLPTTDDTDSDDDLSKQKNRKENSGARSGSNANPWKKGDDGADLPTTDSSDSDAQPKRKPVRRSSNNISVATPAMIETALYQVLNNGNREPVEWFADLLEETANDREEDGDFEPIPVLPISDVCCKAMEEDSFNKLLKLVGIHAPVEHQEMFWRIPSTLTIESLRKRAQYLRKGLSGEIGGNIEHKGSSNNSSDSGSERQIKLKKKRPSKMEDNRSSGDSDNNSVSESSDTRKRVKKIRKKTKGRVLTTADSSSDEEHNPSLATDHIDPEKGRETSEIVRINSSDDGAENVSSSKKENEPFQRVRIDSSSDDDTSLPNIQNKTLQGVVSDSSSDTLLTKIQSKTSQGVSIDSSADEDTPLSNIQNTFTQNMKKSQSKRALTSPNMSDTDTKKGAGKKRRIVKSIDSDEENSVSDAAFNLVMVEDMDKDISSIKEKENIPGNSAFDSLIDLDDDIEPIEGSRKIPRAIAISDSD